jgi:hypothetical protein
VLFFFFLRALRGCRFRLRYSNFGFAAAAASYGIPGPSIIQAVKLTTAAAGFTLDLTFAEFYIIICISRIKPGFECWSFGIWICFVLRYSDFEFKSQRQTFISISANLQPAPQRTTGVTGWTLQPLPWKSPMKPT